MQRARHCTVIVTFIATALLMVGCSDQPARPDSAAETRTVTVTGQSEIKAQPDQARFVVGVTSEAEGADAVLETNSRAADALLTALRDAGVETEQLRTLGVRVNPVWSSRPRNADDDWQPRIRGYQARNQIEVVTRDLQGVGLLLAAAGRAGANEVQGLQFSLENDAEVRDQAITAATEHALAQARTAAIAAGGQTGKVLELNLNGSRPSPMLQRASMDARMELAAVPVEPGEITVNAQVTARIELQD